MDHEDENHFMAKDGLYSWIVLLTIVVNNFCCLGYLFSSVGVFAMSTPKF